MLPYVSIEKLPKESMKIGIRYKAELTCVEFRMSCSTKYVKMKRIWGPHLSYAMGEP